MAIGEFSLFLSMNSMVMLMLESTVSDTMDAFKILYNNLLTVQIVLIIPYTESFCGVDILQIR